MKIFYNFRKYPLDSIKVILSLIPFFSYGVVLAFPFMGNALTAYRLIVTMIYTAYLTSSIMKTKNMIRAFKYIFMYIIFLGIMTAINSGSFIAYIIQSTYIFVPIIIITYHSQKNTSALIGGLSGLFSVLVLANFFLMIVLPGGVYSEVTSTGLVNYHLLGYKNQMSSVLVTAVVIFIVHSYYVFDKLTLNCLLKMFIVVCTIFMGKSSTAIVGLIFMAVFIFLYYRSKKASGIRIQLSVVALLMIAVVVLRLQDVFSFILVDILHKDTTFSNRVFIWDSAIKMILERPFLGYGIQNSLGQVYVEVGYAKVHTFAHNLYLDILIKAGVLGLLFFFNILRYVVHETRKNKDEIIAFYIGLGVSAYLFMSTMDIFVGESCLYILISLAIIMNRIAITKQGYVHPDKHYSNYHSLQVITNIKSKEIETT